MRIKKTSETTPTMASIVDDYAASIQDAYSCSFINDMNNYHTSEFNTHKKWIDGKPVYRIVLTGTTTTTNKIIMSINDTNTMNIIKADGWLKVSATFQEMLGGYVNGDNYSHIYIDPNGMKLLLPNSWVSGNTVSYIIVIEYTKTTD